MLMALTIPSRSADLSSLSISRQLYKPEGVLFLPATLAKQSRNNRNLTPFFFPSFPHNSKLYPVRTLQHYEKCTSALTPERNDRFFVAIVKPHQAVTSSTIARWLKQLLQAAGVAITTFTSHSVRGASSSAAAGAGMTVNDILKVAVWCFESTYI